ncbi:response regulator [Lachnotalea glycerini]|uniref:Stage 0 sporulation protein A homolog n=1 Tax=Lachnotalea glycerini TaxID=1763509 RepID=A0A371JBI8_9FIRM|nr:response regulator [Lachnotalea glycerini]RDY30115.1 response regulator [Lachnotalea glycerini]
MRGKKLSLLIVDDEKSIRYGLKNGIVWSEYGIEVIGIAKDGEEAYKLIQAEPPDIVITDIKMPVCDGLSLIEKTLSQGTTISYIIISGYDDFKYAQKAMKFGVTSYLLKPIKKAVLIEEVTQVCNKIREQNKENQSKTVVTRKIKQGTQAMKQHFLMSLLHSQLRSVLEIERELKVCKSKIKIQNLTNILIFTYEHALEKKELGSLKGDIHLFKSAVCNIMNEILGENVNEIFTDSNDFIVVLLQKPYICVNEDRFLERVCKRIIRIVNDFCRVEMCAGIGNEVSGLLELHESYRSAREYLSYRMYESENTVFDEKILAKRQPPDSFASTRNNTKLIDAIYISDHETILSYTDEFFESLFYIEFPPPNFVRGMCIYLIINVQKELSIYLNEEDSLFKENDYAYINKLSSFQKIKEWIVTLFHIYAEYFSENKNAQKDEVIEKVKNYIDEHIYEKITAEDIAEYIHLSDKYFMNYFKDKTNQNFKSYVLNLKMEKAKELIRQGNKTISEIAHMIGYTDYRGFNRIFKKHFGQTPTEFQDKYKQYK